VAGAGDGEVGDDDHAEIEALRNIFSHGFTIQRFLTLSQLFKNFDFFRN
jgi:hypothetical protein